MGTFHTNHFASIPTFFTSFFSFLNFDYIGHLSFQSQSPGDYIVGTYFRSRYHPMAGQYQTYSLKIRFGVFGFSIFGIKVPSEVLRRFGAQCAIGDLSFFDSSFMLEGDSGVQICTFDGKVNKRSNFGLLTY